MSPFNRRQLLAILLYVRRRRRRKEFWVHPLLQDRRLKGAFYNQHAVLRQYGRKFYNYYRMSVSTFDFILHHIKDNILRQDTTFRQCIPPEGMLAVTLRYLASGNTFTDMHYSYKLGVSTLAEIVNAVCCSIWEIFRLKFLAPPTEENWKAIADEFKKRANFPNCLGAVDGKHIRIEKFPNSGSMYFNYKGNFSIVLMAVVDADYKFIFVNIGSYGKDCDSAIFQRTNFYQQLTDGRLPIPTPTPLHSSLNKRTPHVFVGYEAFPLGPNLLRPYGGLNLNVQQRIYNYRLCRARRYVECAFGILANKWRIFHRPLNLSVGVSQNVVKAYVVLDNIVRERDGYRPTDMYMPVDNDCFQDLAQNNIPAGRAANEIRTDFANYFMSPYGSLPWQMSKI